MTLTVSESWVEDLKRLGAKKVAFITNGYDADDFELKPKKNDKFIIGHYGLLNHLRNPKFLWKTLDDICSENKEFESRLEIHLSGNIDREVIAEIESYPKLKENLKQLGYLSHAQVVQQYNETDILLLLLFNSRSGIGNYPGKIFEYFATNKPILAFGPNNSDTKDLIKETDTGLYFSYEEKEIKKEILKLYKQKKLLKINDLKKFSRENLTVSLSDLLNKL